MRIIITCFNISVLNFFKKHFFQKLNHLEFNTEKPFFEIISENNPVDFKHIILNTGLYHDKEMKFYKPMFTSHLFFNLSNISKYQLELFNNFIGTPVFDDNFFQIYNKMNDQLINHSVLKTADFKPKPIDKLFFNKHLVPFNSKKILILGNGPSLKEIDFMNLDIPTMGMNSAYRYWEKHSWFPDYYISMDDKLIESHHLAMENLVLDKKIRSAFFNDVMFDRWLPELKKHPRVFSFGRIGPNKFFQSSDDNKMTTGAWAVRFAAYLGFTEIYLAGIDCNYIEVLPEAEMKNDGSLEMVETPKENPNYFFDDYQQKGDKYNVPNPAVHQGRLHLDAFRVLKKDCLLYDYGINIYNLSEKSKLNEDSIFELKLNFD